MKSRKPTKKVFIPEVAYPIGQTSNSCDDIIFDDNIFSSDDSNRDNLAKLGVYYITGEIEQNSLLYIHQDVLLKHLSDKWNKAIQIIINSPGGLVSETWALIDLFDYVKMDVQTIGMGYIGSAGALLLASGTKGKRIISKNSHLMVHQFEAGAIGNYSQLVAEQKGLELEQQRHISFWTEHSKFTTEKEVIDNLLKGQDINLSPREALSFGIVDQILGEVLETPKTRKGR